MNLYRIVYIVNRLQGKETYVVAENKDKAEMLLLNSLINESVDVNYIEALTENKDRHGKIPNLLLDYKDIVKRTSEVQ